VVVATEVLVVDEVVLKVDELEVEDDVDDVVEIEVVELDEVVEGDVVEVEVVGGAGASKITSFE
jgi:hypothetical protein